jgi:hypothetical protein
MSWFWFGKILPCQMGLGVILVFPMLVHSFKAQGDLRSFVMCWCCKTLEDKLDTKDLWGKLFVWGRKKDGYLQVTNR